MCADWARFGIQVNGLGPGYIRTNLTQPLQDDPVFDAWVRGRTPAGRWGEREDLMGSIVFLGSHASDFVNGQVLFVDGGMMAVV
jgi:gluconate 5-dehydrogenase